jgi:hypothetical protein
LVVLLWASECIAERVYVPPLAHEPINRIVSQAVLPHLESLFKLVAEKGMETTIDGVKVFKATPEDKFLPGKVAIGFGHVLLNTPRTDPKFEEYLKNYRAIADMTLKLANDTWGIYYYVSALNRLRKAGLLEQAIGSATLDTLKQKLDWRTFVKLPEYTLIGNLPTNYYGVAFGIARLRYILGWEEEKHSLALLDKMITHFKKYSGDYGFSDETEGEGRFDRYSVLLIGEIAQRFIETGMDFPDDLKHLLRQSVDFQFMLANVSGNGFNYGRSIGAYGDTSMLEVLSAAAYLGLLSPEEKEFAYALCARVDAKFVDFWIDQEMHSVNLWEKGRRTDAYRGKHRILGENLSLGHQLVYTNNVWNQAGFQDRVPMSERDFRKWLKQLPRYRMITFAKGEYDRATLIVRDGHHVISLPLVNGGASLYRNNPYFPVPQSSFMLDGTPDEGWPQLIPQFTLSDGSVLMPLSFIKDIVGFGVRDRYWVTYRQDELSKLSGSRPAKDPRIKVETTYRFEPGNIVRSDTYTATEAVNVAAIAMQFGTYSTDADVGHQTVRFRDGTVRAIRVSGLEAAPVVDDVAENHQYHTPNGALNTRATWTTGSMVMDQPITIEWKLSYRRTHEEERSDDDED